MSLRTVRVPPQLEPLFARAEEVVSTYFAQRRNEPEHGTIEIQEQRYVLVRGASLSVEFFKVVRGFFGEERQAEADEFTRNVLFDLAHAIGKADAKNFHHKIGLEDPVARLSAGPVHFSHTGWAYVDISEASNPVAGPDYFLLYDHPYAFESDAWVRSGTPADSPVCIMNAGYSSGWCEESFGLPLVAAEVLCRATGDDCCRFIMAPPDRIEGHIEAWRRETGKGEVRLGSPTVPDLFARKRLEDELREARDNLERRVAERTEELRAANARLQEEMANRARVERMLSQSQKLEALGRLAGGLAHDFNNLLSAMGGYTELLMRELEPGGEAAGFASEIAESISRAASLTQQLLVFSRQRVATTRVVDISRLVDGLRPLLQRLLGEKIVLMTTLCDHGCCVEADPAQLEQVVMNLAVNARDAMPNGGTLRINVDCLRPPQDTQIRASQVVELVVSDTGRGVSEADLEHIFDPFFTTKAPGEGAGLGLAMVYGTVTRWGGSVRAESELGVGTSFEIQLPKVDRSPDDSSLDNFAPPPTSDIRRCVMIVEDDEAVRTLLVRALEDVGHQLVVARSGEHALELWAEKGDYIDAVVSDVIMPNLSGPAMVERLREERVDLPVILISGYAAGRVGRETFSEHNTVFLQKPFDLQTLISKLDRMLEG